MSPQSSGTKLLRSLYRQLLSRRNLHALRAAAARSATRQPGEHRRSVGRLGVGMGRLQMLALLRSIRRLKRMWSACRDTLMRWIDAVAGITPRVRVIIEPLPPRVLNSVTPSGSEFDINQTTAFNQDTPDVGADASGNFVAVWSSDKQDGDQHGIFARRYDATGNPLGAEFQVNETSTDDQLDPRIAVDDSGDFIVTWTSHQSGNNDVYARVFAFNGTPITGEFLVNQTTTNDQSHPDVAVNAAGAFVVTWQGEGTGDSTGVFARRFLADGTINGGEFRVNTTHIGGTQDQPAVAMDDVGDFVVAFRDDNGTDTIYAQIFNSAGVGQGEFTVHANVHDDEMTPAVGMDSAGNFVVAWSGDKIDGNKSGIAARHFSAAGVAQDANDVAVNTYFDRDQIEPAVAMGPNGDHLITWSSDRQDSSSFGVHGQVFLADGTRNGAPFKVNTVTANDQYEPAVAWAGTSGAVAVWSGNTATDGSGIAGQMFTMSTGTNQAPIATAPTNATVAEDATLTFSSGNGNAISISDADAGNSDVQVTLDAPDGVLTLSTIAGLTFTTGDGTADTSMTFTGSITAINAALNGLTFTAATDFNGATAVRVAVDDQGNTGTGGARQDLKVVAVDVTAVNDAPVNQRPAGQTTVEDTTLTFSTAGGNAIAVSDVDAGTSAVSVTLSAGNGTLTLATTTGLSFVTGTGAGDATVTFTGTLADVNAALDGLTFAPTAGFNGSASVQITTSDLGNTGSGGTQSDTDVVAITVTPVADTPTVTDATVGENNQSTNGLIIMRNASDGAEVTHYKITGITGGTLYQANGTTVIANGTFITAAQGAAGLKFTPTPNSTAAGSFNVQASLSASNAGLGGSVVTANITVIPAPTNNVAGAQTVNEDISLIFSTANGNALTVDDPLIALGDDTVDITVTHGTLTLGTTSGLIFTSGDGINDSTMSFAGNLAEINAALEGLVYTPTPNYNGPVTLQISATNLGNILTGPITATSTVAITVLPVADTPSISGSLTNRNAQTTTGLVISRNAADGAEVTHYQITMIGNGSLFLADGVTPVNDGDFITAAQGAAGLRFTPGAGTTLDGWFKVQASTSANGAGLGGSIISANIAVNDPPALSGITGPATYTEGDPAVAVAPLVVVADGDNATLASASIRIIGYVTGQDVLAFTNQNGISGNWNSTTGTLTLTGTASLANYQQALRSVTYANTSDATDTGARSVEFTVNDGAMDSAVASTALTVTAVNDPPALSLPGAQTTAEDTSKVFSSANGNAIVIGDADAGSAPLKVDLASNGGTLTLSGTAGLTFLSGTGAGDQTVTFSGTQAAITAALDGLIFTPSANFSGSASIEITVDDQGNSGAGGAGAAFGTIAVSVTPVNDAPALTLPATQTVEGGSALPFSAGDGNAVVVADVDATAGLMQVDLVATGGTINLDNRAGLTFLAGDGTDDVSMTFTGTLAAIDAALEGMRFNPIGNGPSAAGVQMTVSDLGNTGAGGPQTASGFIPINIIPPPGITITPTSGLTTNEAGGAASFSVVLDHMPTADVTIGLQTSDATEGAPSVSSLTFTPANWNTPQTVVVTGLDDAVDDGDVEYSIVTLPVVSADVRYVGMNGSDVQLTNADDADAPGVVVGATPIEFTEGDAATTLDGALAITADEGLTSAVVDLGPTYVAGEDTLVFNSSGGNSIQGNWDDINGRLTLSGNGSAADYEAALRSVSYANTSADPDGDTERVAAVTVSGPRGTSPGLSKHVRVTPVNTPPTNDTPAGLQTRSNTPVVFSAINGNVIRVGDPDVRNGFVQVTLRAKKGTITLTETRGVTFTLGNGRGNVVVQFSGLISSVNEAMDGMEFRPASGFEGEASLRIVTDDLGNRGVGGRKTTETDVAITVLPVTSQDLLPVTTDDGGTQEVILPPIPDGQIHGTAPSGDTKPAEQTHGSGGSSTADQPAGFGHAQPPAAQGFVRPGNVVLIGSDGGSEVSARYHAEAPAPIPRTWQVDNELFGTSLNGWDESNVDLAGFRERSNDALRWVARSDALSGDLSRLRQQMTSWSDVQHLFAGSAAFVSLGMSVVYVLYTVRAGYLFTSMLSGMPVWNMVDPLPVLEHLGNPLGSRKNGQGEEGDDESLESLVAGERGRGGRGGKVRSRVLGSSEMN